MTGWWALLITLAVVVVLAVVLRSREGRIRSAPARRGASEPDAQEGSDVVQEAPAPLPEALRARLGHEPDARITLLQLSTTFCAPCRHARILLADLAERTDGVRHVDVDLTHHPEWSTPLRVHTTPTTLVLDEAECELFRVSGVPRRADLLDALRPHLG